MCSTLVYDEDLIRNFYRKVIANTPRADFDTDFFCVVARSKYLSGDYRHAIQLGDALLEKVVLKTVDEERFLNRIHRADSCVDWATSFNGKSIPKNCMVMYMNVNHTSSVKAIRNLKNDIETLENELVDCLLGSGMTNNIGNKLKNLDTLVLKAMQNPKCISKKNWIDIDMDIPNDMYTIDNVMNVLNNLGISEDGRVIIMSRGGYHILIRTSFISEYNSKYVDTVLKGEKVDKTIILSIDKIVDAFSSDVADRGYEAKEIKINQNMMVPIPGTIQGNHKVEMY